MTDEPKIIEYPKMLYKGLGQNEADQTVVKNKKEEGKYLKKGWCVTLKQTEDEQTEDEQTEKVTSLLDDEDPKKK